MYKNYCKFNFSNTNILFNYFRINI